ncbi:MAG: hypothetical protein JNM75_08525 [Rhodospirillales bacterium]|nr:hypothetical protein [Rhodospirillales bacterium]
MTIKRLRGDPGDGGNEWLFLSYGALAEVATRLASPQVVMPWIYTLIGGPLFLFGLLVPSVRLGAIASQLAALPILEAAKFRKWITVAASLIMAALLALVCVAVLELPTALATAFFFICTLCFGACNGTIQLTSQDAMARTVPLRRIAGLVALQSSLGGAMTLALSASLILINRNPGSPNRHLTLIAVAAAVWLVAALCFSLIKEPAGDVAAKQSLWQQACEGVRLYARVPWFRRYIAVRMLFLSVGLATPFYSIHAATLYQGAAHSLTIFVIAVGLANMLSGLVWRRMLSRDSRYVLVLVGFVAATAGLIAISEGRAARADIPYVYAVVLFLLAISEQGLTQASKTYVALIASNRERPLFLAVNNVLLSTLAVPVSSVLGVVAHMTHIIWALCILVVVTLCASINAFFMVPPPQT